MQDSEPLSVNIGRKNIIQFINIPNTDTDADESVESHRRSGIIEKDNTLCLRSRHFLDLRSI